MLKSIKYKLYNFGDYVSKKWLYSYILFWRYSVFHDKTLFQTIRQVYKYSRRQKRINLQKADSLPYASKHFLPMLNKKNVSY